MYIFNEDDRGITNIDTWYPTTVRVINDKLGLSPESSEETLDNIKYKISDSDAFSRVFSKLNRSMDFEYVDNESAYDNNRLTLVFTFDNGKVILNGNMDNEEYTMEVKRS